EQRIRDQDRARLAPDSRLQQRALVVRHDGAKQLEDAPHALVGLVRRLEELCDIVERPGEELPSTEPGCRGHGSTLSVRTGSPVSTPRKPANAGSTSIPSALIVSRRTSVTCCTPLALRTEIPRSREPATSTYLSWMTLSAANETPWPESCPEPSRSTTSMFMLRVTPAARKCLVTA